MNIDETIKWFNSLYDVNKQLGEQKRSYCCSITNNAKCNKKGFLIGSTKCDKLETAKCLIKKLEEEGFLIDGEGDYEDKDPIIVNMYRKA